MYQIGKKFGVERPLGKEWFSPYYEDAEARDIWLEKFNGVSFMNLAVTRGQMAELIMRFKKAYQTDSN